jgi:Kef-type K+ transport system membrane component KefB
MGEQSVRGRVWLIAAWLMVALPAAAAAADAAQSGHSVIANIAICMVSACVLGLVMKALRQPLILGYILAGVLIGPVGARLIVEHADIVTVSEIGLILLLFMIGLEIDLQKMLAAGRLVIVTGLLQFPLCALLSYAAFTGLEAVGVSLGSGYARLYAATAVSLSSTMIVVKLLYDKLELDTLPGRITVGILIFQDVWAIIALAVQPNLSDPHLSGLLQTFAAGGLLVGAALLLSKYVLPRIFHAVAKLPELLLVISLGWCFLVCLVAAHPLVGLSMEMGALIAGVSLATFPYSLDVIGKVVTIRDFFITLFFVALGMQIPAPQPRVLLLALITALVTVGVRVFGVFGVLHTLRAGHRAALLPTINLCQVSEFSLVILSLGVARHHIEHDTLTVIVWVFSSLAVASTYLVTYSHDLQRIGSRWLAALGIHDVASVRDDSVAHKPCPIVVLGFFRIASSFLFEAAQRHQHLLPLIKVVDFNPLVKQQLDAMGVACVYGDIGHRDTLQHAHLDDARVVLCTIPDSLLKGTTNQNLMNTIRALCPEAQIVVTAESAARARDLYRAGADYVLQPSTLSGAALVPVVEQALHETLSGLKDEAVGELGERNEILA